MGQAEEAKTHVLQAEKALKPSWLSLKFAPDYLVASVEYQQAATKYRAAGLLTESVGAWINAAEAKVQCQDQFGAGRAYESAGAVCAGGGPGGAEAAVEHWSKAIQCFRLSGKGEIAAKLLLKQAEVYEKQKDTCKAKQAFENAIEVYQDDEKDHMLGDVYKQYIGFLLRAKKFEDALKAIDGHVTLLLRQGHTSFVHKELLSKIVITLELKDSVRAEEALTPSTEVQGWFVSKECQVGNDLVAAYRSNDVEATQTVLKEQVFTFLHIEVARIAKQLWVSGCANTSYPATAGDGVCRGGAGSSSETPMSKEDMQDMLL